MDIDSEKLEKVFHDILKIIIFLKEIDAECKEQECVFRTDRVHDELVRCQMKLLELRRGILEALAEEEK